MKTYLLIKNKKDYTRCGGFFLYSEGALRGALQAGYKIIFDFESRDFNLHTSIWTKYQEACLTGWSHLTHRHQDESLEQLQERHKIVQAMIEEKFKDHLASIPDDND